jgi:hypothetical protein
MRLDVDKFKSKSYEVTYGPDKITFDRLSVQESSFLGNILIIGKWRKEEIAFENVWTRKI